MKDLVTIIIHIASDISPYNVDYL